MKCNYNHSQLCASLGELCMKLIVNLDCLLGEQSKVINSSSPLNYHKVLIVALIHTSPILCENIDNCVTHLEIEYSKPERQASAKKEVNGFSQARPK